MKRCERDVKEKVKENLRICERVLKQDVKQDVKVEKLKNDTRSASGTSLLPKGQENKLFLFCCFVFNIFRVIPILFLSPLIWLFIFFVVAINLGVYFQLLLFC
jgi:hypothetical protein